jgi:hypothetical protein
VILTALAAAILCALLCPFFSSCNSLANKLESYLECDEEVDIKYKIDFKDKDEQKLEKLIPKMAEEYQVAVKDDDMARKAMIQTLTVMEDKTTPAALKLQAARTILEWTKQKPAQKNEHTVKRAEDFLIALAEKESDGPVIIEHQEAPQRRLPILREARPDDQDEARDD